MSDPLPEDRGAGRYYALCGAEVQPASLTRASPCPVPRVRSAGLVVSGGAQLVRELLGLAEELERWAAEFEGREGYLAGVRQGLLNGAKQARERAELLSPASGGGR